MGTRQLARYRNGSFTFVSFVIAAQTNPDESSAVVSCDDFATFESNGDFVLASQERHTPRTLPGRKAGIHQWIKGKTTTPEGNLARGGSTSPRSFKM